MDREGQPMFAVERFIDGRDSYGRGFLKHNTNSGFVDEEQRRKTPQVFSAHSFYASSGTRLVADVQGVGDLYTGESESRHSRFHNFCLAHFCNLQIRRCYLLTSGSVMAT